MNAQTQPRSNDALTIGERVSQVFILGGMLLLIVFFVAHQFGDTGFFTRKFGTFEGLCLYAPMLLALVPPIARICTGQRNSARLLEAFSDLCLAFGSFWLLIVFPFNYAQLADVLPYPLRFILAWITDDIARIFFVLQIIIAFISSIVFMLQYIASRSRVAYAMGR